MEVLCPIRIFRRFLPHPGILAGVGLQLHSIDVDVRQIRVLLRKDGQIDILKNRFNALRQHRFQHIDRIVPVSSRDVFRNVLQVLAYIDSLHESVECQHRVRYR